MPPRLSSEERKGLRESSITKRSEARLSLIGGWAEEVAGRDEDSCSEFVEVLTYTSAVQLEMASG